ncbi:hypothetical protein RHMOL_Rhmol01G0323100 [Rhododendron molle]|uniref:Uncharacterized protein n=1 Tax=Rhododendron molle TaxID=49168 RepID=A0ACC0Q9E5_RHOML|nr:hypothetical protein RHMOL_Rhmol01G0323100 [Rhododendron molle]
MATTDPDHRDAEEATAGEDEDTGAQVTPLVKLQEVAVTTGEEEEDAILDLKAKLYRFDKEGNQWKERGVGTVKLLKHKENGKVRLVMRQSKTLKICANHLVGPTMSVQEYAGNDKACVWHAADFSDGERKDEFFCIRFGSIDILWAITDDGKLVLTKEEFLHYHQLDKMSFGWWFFSGVCKAKFAITNNQGLHFKEGEEHTFHQFDYLATTESLAKPLLGLEPYEVEGHTRMKVNKELLAKLRVDRGAILEGELARKKQKLGGDAKGTDEVGVVIFEMPRANEGMQPKEAIDTAAFLSKSAGKKPLNIEEPSIKVDPKETDNRLSNSQVDMRKLDELPDKELYEKCLASLGKATLYMYATTARCLTNFNHSLAMEDIVRKATIEKEDLMSQVDQQRTMKNQLKEDINLKDVQLQSYADVVSARDNEIVALKHKMLCLRNLEAKAKEAGALEYKKSQGFTDSMTIYFFEGFEAFCRRAMATYPGVAFKIFKADDDLPSLMTGEEEGAGVVDDAIQRKRSHVA